MNSIDDEENLDHINRLPDDVLLAIFSWLKDAKCLLSCYIVSRRFASVVTRVKITHFTISSCNVDNSQVPEANFRRKVQNVLTKPLNYLQNFFLSRLIGRGEQAGTCRSMGLSLHDAAKFMEKFREIESLFIYIPGMDQDEPVIKWEAVLSKEWDYFVVLIASRVRETDPEEDEAIDIHALHLTTAFFKSRLKLAADCFRDSLWRHHTTRHIIGENSHVQAVLFTDTKNEGTLYLCRGQVEDLLNVEPNLTFDLRDSAEVQARSRFVKLWHVPLLHMPICKKTMEGATLVLISLINQPIENDIMRFAFREDEIFSEAANEIYQKHNTDGFALTVNMNLDNL